MRAQILKQPRTPNVPRLTIGSIRLQTPSVLSQKPMMPVMPATQLPGSVIHKPSQRHAAQVLDSQLSGGRANPVSNSNVSTFREVLLDVVGDFAIQCPMLSTLEYVSL